MSSVQEFLSTNQATILYVVIAMIIAYFVWGWYKGYTVNVNYDTTPRDQRQRAQEGYPAM